VQIHTERVDDAPNELPSGGKNLPARAESAEVEARREGGTSLIPNVTKAASRWIRPFEPPIIASAVDTATKSLRGVPRPSRRNRGSISR
jgi:hypothetical protein